MKTIGQLATAIVKNPSTDSSQHVGKLPTDRVEALLTKPAGDLTAGECKELTDWASTISDKPIPATNAEFAALFEYIGAMPSKSDDFDMGRKRLVIYRRMLGSYSLPALQFMSHEVFARFTFFPSVAQCLEILREYREPPTVKDRVTAICQQSAQIRFERFAEALKDKQDQDWIDAHPAQWRRVALERGLLRLQSGRMVQRIRTSEFVELTA
jgi:hypothetical protein